MKIVIAPDSFKESLSALEVAQIIEQGFRQVLPDAQYIKCPMADGGEGTVQSLIDALNGKQITVLVTAPLGNHVTGFYGYIEQYDTAIIEMAVASGIQLVPTDQRNPLLTSSWGTGELILSALDQGVKHIILGIGGSATNDGGAGMLAALGVKLLNIKGQPISPNGQGLAELHHIDISKLDPRLKNVTIQVACDVDNPLCGPQGASAIFGPQKGATPEMIVQLDANLHHFADCIKQQLHIDVLSVPGGGAAGGVGAALMAFLNAQLNPGVEIVIQSVKLAEVIKDADLVITGEGRIDGQSIHGKTPIGVARCAKQFNKPVIGIAGCLGKGYEQVYEHGIDAVFSVMQSSMTLEQALVSARENVLSTARNIAALWQLKQQK